jgi:hypothetical protein
MRRATLAAAIAGCLLLAPSIGATTIAIDYEDETGGFYQKVKNAFSYDYTFALDEAGIITASLASWALTIGGFALIGFVTRRQKPARIALI